MDEWSVLDALITLSRCGKGFNRKVSPRKAAKATKKNETHSRTRNQQSAITYGTQSAMKILVSCGALALRFEAHTSFFPSGLNMGKPSKPSL